MAHLSEAKRYQVLIGRAWQALPVDSALVEVSSVLMQSIVYRLSGKMHVAAWIGKGDDHVCRFPRSLNEKTETVPLNKA